MACTDSTLVPLPAEPAALQGWDPTLAVIDELHVVGEATWEAMALAAGKAGNVADLGHLPRRPRTTSR